MRGKTAVIPIVLILIISLICRGGGFSQANRKEAGFEPPLKMPLYLSGNFGEVRSNHFHSGIDIKTRGSTGEPVYAIADGFISRIKVEPGGYGKALYLTHQNGYTSVYGHLQEFSHELSEYVIEQQYRKKSFRVDLFPPAGRFSFSKGELIALSGNSGSSDGPHLHFEIRDTQTENPLNPLLYSINVNDSQPPVIYSINFYSLSDRREHLAPLKIIASGSNGRYFLKSSQPYPVDKTFGIGIETLDFLDGSSNKCGVYSIKMFVDGQLQFHSEMDEFSFAETRFINSYIDYKEFRRRRSSTYKCFIDPNNNLSILRFARNKGIVEFDDDEIHRIGFELLDAAGNQSTIEFSVRRNTATYLAGSEPLPLYNAYFHYAEPNRFEEENVIIEVPAKALYNNLYFNYESGPAPKNSYSRLHKIHNEFVPVHKNYTLLIKPESLPDHLKPYALIAMYDEKNNRSPVGGKWDDGYLIASPRVFGNFAVTVDTIPPAIRPRNFITGNDILKLKQISFTISDNLSGISEYRGEIDGEWVLFEWDPKNNLLFHDLSHKPLDPKTPHKLFLRVKDERGNTSEYMIEIK